MKGGRKRIDQLLDRNATEQLERVDWDQLTDEISARLDRARQIEVAPSRWPVFFKIAAGVVAAAAAIFVIVVLRMQGPSDVRVPKGRSAVVAFVDKQGSTSLQIEDAILKSFVVVHAGRSGGKVTKCEVEIMDRSGAFERESSRAAWIIISRPKRTVADNGHRTDETDVICML